MKACVSDEPRCVGRGICHSVLLRMVCRPLRAVLSSWPLRGAGPRRPTDDTALLGASGAGVQRVFTEQHPLAGCGADQAKDTTTTVPQALVLHTWGNGSDIPHDLICCEAPRRTARRGSQTGRPASRRPFGAPQYGRVGEAGPRRMARTEASVRAPYFETARSASSGRAAWRETPTTQCDSTIDA